MVRPLPHDAVLADARPPDLKLRLCKADDASPGLEPGRRHGQDEAQGDEGHVDADEVGILRHLLARQVAHVETFQADDPLVRAQLPGQLPLPHVDGVDAGGPSLQHAVREPAGRGADVHADATPHGKRPQVERFLEFQAATPHVGQALLPYLDAGTWVHLVSRLVAQPAVHRHIPGHDRGSGALPGGVQATGDEQDIKTLLQRCP